MKKIWTKCIAGLLLACYVFPVLAKDVFPDGNPIPGWFRQTKIAKPEKLGKIYRITDYGVKQDSTLLQTERIQAVIDRAANEGGGVVWIPKGTFLSGSLFFKPKTHLYIEKEGTLKGSDDISHFTIIDTRMEGQNLKYFAALVNAIGVDGFTLSGKGCINGNGMRYWKSFWLRREVNKDCTNLEELRPRLVHVADSKNVQLSGVRLENSPFWTTHIYRCRNVQLLGLRIFAPHKPVKAPSSDAIDIDVCTNVLIKDCYLSVNDDAIALKGGKGPWADRDKSNNGSNCNVVIEDCTFGFCHSALTCGSESIYNHNIVLRRCHVDRGQRLLWLKMRPDTPQNYEYITVEKITGHVSHLIYAQPWTQFFDLKGRKDIPHSYSRHITMRDIQMECDVMFNISRKDEQYTLSDFRFENLDMKVNKNAKLPPNTIRNCTLKNITVNGKRMTR